MSSQFLQEKNQYCNTVSCLFQTIKTANGIFFSLRMHSTETGHLFFSWYSINSFWSHYHRYIDMLEKRDWLQEKALIIIWYLCIAIYFRNKFTRLQKTFILLHLLISTNGQFHNHFTISFCADFLSPKTYKPMLIKAGHNTFKY